MYTTGNEQSMWIASHITVGWASGGASAGLALWPQGICTAEQALAPTPVGS